MSPAPRETGLVVGDADGVVVVPAGDITAPLGPLGPTTRVAAAQRAIAANRSGTTPLTPPQLALGHT